jgi:hypothetical protein
VGRKEHKPELLYCARKKHENTKFQKTRKYLDVFFVRSPFFRAFVIRIFILQSPTSRPLEAAFLLAVERSLFLLQSQSPAPFHYSLFSVGIL